MSNAQPGRFDGSGRRQWWDHHHWTEHFGQAPSPVAAHAFTQPPAQSWAQQLQWQQHPAPHWHGPRVLNRIPVSCVRQRQGHSLSSSVTPNRHGHA